MSVSINSAIKIMEKLVGSYSGSPVPLYQLMEGIGSVSHAEQAMAIFKASGLVKSTRGIGGGYIPTSEDITVSSIVRAFNPKGFLMSPAVLQALDDIPVTRVFNTDVENG